MNNNLRTILNDHGRRSTEAQYSILAYLQDQAPVTTDQLRSDLEGNIPTTTIYRTLGSFRKMGIVRDVVIGGSRKIELTELFSPHHHHISCKQCGKTIDIHDQQLERYLRHLATQRGFTQTEHSFEISGVCPECAN